MVMIIIQNHFVVIVKRLNQRRLRRRNYDFLVLYLSLLVLLLLLCPSFICSFSTVSSSSTSSTTSRIIKNQHNLIFSLKNTIIKSSSTDDEYNVVSQENNIDTFIRAMDELKYTKIQKNNIIQTLVNVGLMEKGDDVLSTQTLQAITNNIDTSDITSMLINDFHMKPLIAHQIRAALQHNIIITTTTTNKTKNNNNEKRVVKQKVRNTASVYYNDNNNNNKSDFITIKSRIKEDNTNNNGAQKEDTTTNVKNTTVVVSKEKTRYKSVIINEAQKQRIGLDNYGLPTNYENDFPITANEMKEFYIYMTIPNTYGEQPIRTATADIYIRHAKLFLGWYYKYILNENNNKEDLSIYKIFLTNERESAHPILHFIQWLRINRKISISYEANILRGMVKLLKFRFCRDSSIESKFDDIPVIKELRRWHREANKKQRIAPRVSKENLKWLSWIDYLNVVQNTRTDVRTMITKYENDYRIPPTTKTGIEKQNRYIKQIGYMYQKYLILAIFANVPDRQRTIRELEIGRSFIKGDDKDLLWCIKHTPEDYKTGKAYGDRPPLVLPAALSIEIDEFINKWRNSLLLDDNEKYLFVGQRTGKQLTSDTVYHIVARTCYQYTGKRTNPHLLRDMIVTHVREKEDGVTEQQLEALALFMGHSVHVQRTSYDRRTLNKKVQPAIALLEQVNSKLTQK